MKFIASLMIAMVVAAAGCSDDTTCGSDSDCFSGEFCSDGECVVGDPPREDSGANNTNNASDAGGEVDVVDMAAEDAGNVTDSGTSTNNNTNNVTNNTTGTACVIDPFGNTCEEDEFEENDDKDNPNMATDPSAWCDMGDLARPVQSFSGTLCPGDDGDFFRMQIDNRSPDECLSDRFTIRMTVALDRSCPTDALDIRPHTFFSNPDTENLCTADENLRCAIEDEGQTYVFEWSREAEQLVDPRLMVRALRGDIQLDYTVTVEIIQ